MKLTPEAAAALERLRNGDMSQHVGDCIRMIRELGRLLFPKGHDEEITPERLAACGGKQGTNPDGGISSVVDMGHKLWAWFTEKEVVWLLDGVRITASLYPKNMGEVWNLMERCGLEVKHVKE